tara:strand:+ start:5005 stop:5991 length:987 start_codon:yes stop_codon:yes gene_type:complete
MENLFNKKLKIFKGGSLSSTSLVNHYKFGNCILKETSIEHDREYGFVRFSSQIKRHHILKSFYPNVFPDILEMGINDYNQKAYCLYEYKEGYIPLIEFLIFEKDKFRVKKAAKNLLLSLDNLHQNGLKTFVPKGALDYYVKEEMIRPLKNFSKNFNTEKLSINNHNVLSTDEFISFILELLKSFDINKEYKHSLIHGNSTLENILINSQTLEISLIDPYDETYFDCALSDFSQILQCSKYYYGLRMSSNENKTEIDKFKLTKANNMFIYFNDLIENELYNKKIDFKLLNLLVVSQFTRLLPFRICNNDFINAKYFYSLASWIFKDNFL